MTEPQWIISAGIDLGTSTTKMIVSRLRLARSSGRFSLPKFSIVERELLYASGIYSTPLRNADEIDAEQVSAIIRKEFEAAGFQPSDIKSGAVIITGETATKTNARQILNLVAERSGDFVVATAGADLEALLAGKGSGAEERSRHIRGVVANVDIGGGTANTAFFHRGKLIGTVTFHVGGRLIRLTRSGEILSVSPQIAPWLKAKGFALEAGGRVSFERLKDIAASLNRSMLSVLGGGGPDPAAQLLILGEPPAHVPDIEELMISGGVGELMKRPMPAGLEETAVYGDIGPLLAGTLKEECARGPFRLAEPSQTVRATVIGAGMQSTEISGATIHIDASLLPIRNLPVQKLELTEASVADDGLLAQTVDAAFATGSRLYGSGPGGEAGNGAGNGAGNEAPFAVALSGLRYCSYSALQRLSERIASAYKRHCPHAGVLVVICENDMAKALGQSLAARCGSRPRIICIDQVKVEHGDYLDLGEPISGTMIPVIVKTLVFQ